MKNEIKIDNVIYPLSTNKDIYKKSALYVNRDENNNINSISLVCHFDRALTNSDEEDVQPSLSIENINTSAIKSLVGFSYEVKTMNESYERGDAFYYYEYKPLENYKFIINDYNDDYANISIIGTVIIDDSSRPYKTKKIGLHCVVPVKIFKNEIKIDNVIYLLSTKQGFGERSVLYVNKDENNDISSISLACHFDRVLTNSEEESVQPSLYINDIDASTTKSLTGFSFEVKSAEESYERDDTFYYYEHEPFENYKFVINDYNDDYASISIIGTAITDGYSDPYETKTIELHCVIPVTIYKKTLLSFTANVRNNILFPRKLEFVFYNDEFNMYEERKLIRKINYEDIKEIVVMKKRKNNVFINCKYIDVNIYKVSDEICTKIKEITRK